MNDYFRPLAEAVLIYLPEEKRPALNYPKNSSYFVNTVVKYALLNLEIFGEKLAETIAATYHYGPGFIQDSTLGRNGPLWLDEEGHIVSLINVEFDRTNINRINDFESYDVLTGLFTGQSFTPRVRPVPLSNPNHTLRVIKRWFQSQPLPVYKTITLQINAELLHWYQQKGSIWEHVFNSALINFSQDKRNHVEAIQKINMGSTKKITVDVPPDIFEWYLSKGKAWEEYIHLAIDKHKLIETSDKNDRNH